MPDRKMVLGACPKCGGTLQEGYDTDAGTYIHCLMCGDRKYQESQKDGYFEEGKAVAPR